jgi:hypothetical protein
VCITNRRLAFKMCFCKRNHRERENPAHRVPYILKIVSDRALIDAASQISGLIEHIEHEGTSKRLLPCTMALW